MIENRVTVAMDHKYIEDHRIADRYLDRSLNEAERSSFEKHFVDCAECMDRLALAEIFRSTPPRHRDSAASRGPVGPLAPVPIEHTEVADAAIRNSLSILRSSSDGSSNDQLRLPNAEPGPVRRNMDVVAIFATAALLLVSVPTAYLIWQYATERKAERGPAGGIFSLTQKRVKSIPVSLSPHPVVFLLEMPNPPAPPRRVSLRTDGFVVWDGGELADVEGEALAVVIPSRDLPPGDLVLRIESRDSGSWRVAADFPITVVRVP
ncbi:MAG: zf-HC2 domain-containing protein [Bryobacteraceae bacterium]